MDQLKHNGATRITASEIRDGRILRMLMANPRGVVAGGALSLPLRSVLGRPPRPRRATSGNVLVADDAAVDLVVDVAEDRDLTGVGQAADVFVRGTDRRINDAGRTHQVVEGDRSAEPVTRLRGTGDARVSWVASIKTLPPSKATRKPTQPASLSPPTLVPGAPMATAYASSARGTALADVLQGVNGIAELIARDDGVAEV